jgi:hypothetical protein
MDNPEKLATLSTQNTRRRQTKQKTQHHIMCWTQLYTNNKFKFKFKILLSLNNTVCNNYTINL